MNDLDSHNIHWFARATQTSHPILPIAATQTWVHSSGIIISYKKKLGLILGVLDPLLPENFSNLTEFTDWAGLIENFEKEIGKLNGWIALSDEFKPILESLKWVDATIGKEPWVDLKNSIPKGNTGKGVRAARNQAIRAGLKVREIKVDELQGDSWELFELKRMLALWKSRRIFHLDGFLNSTDPFSDLSQRRIFICTLSPEKIQAFVTVIPLPRKNSVFIEDLISHPVSHSGASELLLTEVMTQLGGEGYSEASLGVVSLLENKSKIQFIQMLGKLVYHSGGIGLFRKRFNPTRWDKIFVCLPLHQSSAFYWLKVAFTTLMCFEPKFHFSFTAFKLRWTQKIARYPLSTLITTAIISAFLYFNVFHSQHGQLPEWALQRFGFSPSATGWEWIPRSLVSDLLFYDKIHFLSVGIPLIALLIWIERVQSKLFSWTLVFFSFCLDDIFDAWFVFKPITLLQTKMFEHLIEAKDVGPSLTLLVLLGVQLHRMGKKKDFYLIFCCIGLILYSLFISQYHHLLILNLNHLLFLLAGYGIGALRLAYIRANS